MSLYKLGDFMSIKVSFYTFDKKPNSTKQPTIGGAEFMCNFIEPLNILTPEITIDVGYTANPAVYIYAYIEDFSRFYFVTNWTYNSGLWIATLRVDVLASWKVDIGNSDKYILRSASKSNGNVLDTTYPTTSRVKYETTYVAKGWDFCSYKDGVYILGIIGAYDIAVGDPKAGSVKYWAFTYDQLQYFISLLMGNTDWFSTESDPITEISNSLIKTLFNPLDYIVSCRWYPFSVNVLDVIQQPVLPYGWWALDVQCYSVEDSVTFGRTFGEAFTFPKHPQSSRGDYLNNKPFTIHTLNIEPWGSIEIDGTFAKTDCLLTTQIDITTGDCVLNLSVENLRDDGLYDKINLPSRYSKIGVDIPITQLSINAKQVAQDVVNVVTNAATQNYVGSLGAAIGAITDFTTPEMQNLHGGGTFIGLNRDITLTSVFYYIADEDNTERGRPLCSVQKISDLSGYVQCADGDIVSDCTITERNEISSYLTGGFFYE